MLTLLALAIVACVVTAIILSAHRDGPADAPGKRARAEHIEALARRAKELEQSSHLVELEAVLTELTTIQPEVMDWWSRLLGLELTGRRYTDAVATYRRALDAPLPASDANSLRMALAAQLLELGDLPAARRELEQLKDLGVKHPQIDVSFTRLLRLEGKPAEALEYFTNNVPAGKRDAPALLLLGLLEFDLGDFEAARTHLAEAARLNPYGEFTHFKLAECCRLLGDAEAEQQHRARYRTLHAARTEISFLLQRLDRDGSLDPAQKRQLAEAYAAVGQTSESEKWNKRAQE